MTIDLNTEYMGLLLKNPLVPSASPLSKSLDSAKQLEDHGAAALVMYSLFEEELRHEEEMNARFLVNQQIGFGEADSFLPCHEQYRHGLDLYLEQINGLKATLDIPVIASLNGVTPDGWITHAQLLAQAGADALELNMYFLSTELNVSAAEMEARYLELMVQLRCQVLIPVAVKLSPHFSALPNFLQKLQQAGANGAVLFNRFYQPDIDPDSLQVLPQLQFSNSSEALLAMRWIAILAGRLDLQLAATGGIHTSRDVIKLLLAGADITQLCSTLLIHGPQQIQIIMAGLISWMENNEFNTINDFRGILSQRGCADKEAFERANYLSILNSYTPSPGVWR